MSEPIVILGATGGFGSAIARRLHADGHALVLQGRNTERLAALGDALAVPTADRLQFDLTDETAATATFADLSHRYGALGAVVLSVAKPFTYKLTHRQPWSVFDEQMQVQLRGIHVAAVAARPLLAAREATSRFVVISTEAVLGIPPMKTAAYSAAKAAMTAYAGVIAQEWLKDGIRVHILAPGLARTDLVADMPDAFLDQLAEGMPEKMLTRAEDIADMTAFCLTDGADPLYGQPIRVSRAARR